MTFFPQPCVALCADRKCRVYADRPGQCRAFECGVFKDAQSGRITGPVALRQVKQARKKADAIRRLLRKLGIWMSTARWAIDSSARNGAWKRVAWMRRRGRHSRNWASRCTSSIC